LKQATEAYNVLYYIVSGEYIMEFNRKTAADLFKGLVGGVFIAVGALSAIGFTENAGNCISAIIFLIIGALIGIVLDMLKISKFILSSISVIAFATVFFAGLEYAQYAAAGVVMYIGCALALPEKDIITNAVTGASAAVGFIAAVLCII